MNNLVKYFTLLHKPVSNLVPMVISMNNIQMPSTISCNNSLLNINLCSQLPSCYFSSKNKHHDHHHDEKSKLKQMKDFISYAWDKTFPQEKFQKKFQKHMQEAKQQKILEEKVKGMTEEEKQNLTEQEKKILTKSLVLVNTDPKISAGKELTNKFKNRFNETDFAKTIFSSDAYKEFLKLKSELKDFKSEVNEYVQNSNSIIIQGAMALRTQIETESNVAKCVKIMRKLQPDFDLWEFEEDAKVISQFINVKKGIFAGIYTIFLQNNFELLQKVCGEVSFQYFKVLQQKWEETKSEPKYKFLWDIEKAQFLNANADEQNNPIFTFSIKTQEIYCQVSKNDHNKIIDGSLERLFFYEYIFALKPHHDPCVDQVGHSWQLIDISPKEVQKLLV